MGAIQAYHWAALYPAAVERAVINCGVARTAVHNRIFLRSLMAILVWGHRAGNPEDNPEDYAFLRTAVRDWLER